eukprot:scaffold7014_cov156-Skeletonema_marinoi.AAC.1
MGSCFEMKGAVSIEIIHFMYGIGASSTLYLSLSRIRCTYGTTYKRQGHEWTLVASATQHHSSSLLLMSLPVRKKRKLSLEFCWFAGGMGALNFGAFVNV